MTTGPLLQVGDLTIPEPMFTPYAQNLTARRSKLVRSGALVLDPLMSRFLKGPGRIHTMPAMNDLDDDPEYIASDDAADIIALSESAGTPALPASFNDAIPYKPTATEESFHRLSRNNHWSESDLARELSGLSSMEAVAKLVSGYWERALQRLFVAVWSGVAKDNGTNDGGDYAYDAAGASFIDGTTNFTGVNAIRAAATMGDVIDQLTLLMVHPIVYNTMQEKNLIEFKEESNALVRIPFYQNMMVIVDRSLPSGTAVTRGDGTAGGATMYESWLFGPAATGWGRGSRSVPTAVHREELAGQGGGETVLTNRVAWGIHPRGHSYIGAATKGGPSNATMNTAAVWDRAVPEREQVKFARLITREA